ncbi:MAG: RNA polymerase sigma factor [Nitriliruptorales bacterium]
MRSKYVMASKGSRLTIGTGFDDVLAAAQANAPWAFQRLYEELAPVVTGYLRLRGAAEPDDLCSEVFLGVFRNLGSFSGGEEGFRSWVFTIAHRRLLDERRSAGRRPETEALTDPLAGLEGGDVESEALDELGHGWVAEVLDVLTSDQREVLLLRVVADLPVEEVAEIVGKRPGSVRAAQHRAIETLRRELARGRISDPRGRRG